MLIESCSDSKCDVYGEKRANEHIKYDNDQFIIAWLVSYLNLVGFRKKTFSYDIMLVIIFVQFLIYKMDFGLKMSLMLITFLLFFSQNYHSFRIRQTPYCI